MKRLISVPILGKLKGRPKFRHLGRVRSLAEVWSSHISGVLFRLVSTNSSANH